VLAGIDVLCEDGEVHKTKKAKNIIIPNFEAKSELWKHFESFSKNLKSIQAALKLEEEERAKTGGDIWLYDDTKSNSQMKVVGQ